MIKRLLKWLLRIAAVLVLLFILLLVFKDAILRTLAEARIREQTGMDAKIGKFSVGLLSPVVSIEDFKLYNTAEFGGTLFLNIPELHVEFDPVALARRKLRITLMRFNLAELDIVKNAAGKTNVLSFAAKTQAQGKESATAKLQQAGFTFAGIAVLNLTLGKVRFIDLKDKRQNREFQLGVKNVLFKNVKSERDFGLKLFVVMWQNGTNAGLTPGNILMQYLSGKTGHAQSLVQDLLDVPPKR